MKSLNGLRPRTARQLCLALAMTLAVVPMARAALPVTYVVNTTIDTGTGGCTASECTLREAIVAANAAVGSGLIKFSIPGDPAGAHTLSLNTPLPAITDALDINGYSEPGAAINTSPTGFNAVLKIRLSGFTLTGAAVGLRVQSATAVTLRGLAIHSFRSSGSGDTAGIVLNGSGSVNIHGCRIGGIAGDSSAGNRHGIIVGSAQTGVVNVGGLGGLLLTARNAIEGADVDAILIRNGTGTVNISSNIIRAGAVGNAIHTLRAGTSIRSNAVSDSLVGAWLQSSGFTVASNTFEFNSVGLRIDTSIAAQETVGGAGDLANTFEHSLTDGIEHLAPNMSVDFSQNRFALNDGLGVDLLGGNGITPNDTGDIDAGANGLQNFPVVTSATRTAGSPVVTISGTLNSQPNRSYRLRLYGNTFATAAADREGGHVGDASIDVTTDASGDASFGPIQVNFNEGEFPAVDVSATATLIDATSGLPAATSELAAAVSIVTINPPATFTVTSQFDDGDGVCDATCTLRDAIVAANGNGNPGSIDDIHFAIDGDIVHSIILSTSLPALVQPVTIDGYTESDATPNSDVSGVGSNASIRIHIKPTSNALFGVFGGFNTAASITLRGLAFTEFNAGNLSEIRMNGANARIEGCWFGLRPDGTESLTRTALIMGNGAILGGDAPAQRNIWINRSKMSVGNDAQVINNLFGVKSDGRSAATTSSVADPEVLDIGARSRVERNVFSTPSGKFAILATGGGHLIDNSFGESHDGASAITLAGAILVLNGGIEIRSGTHAIRGASGGSLAGGVCEGSAVCFLGSSTAAPSVLDQPISGGAAKGVAIIDASAQVSIRSVIQNTGGLAIDLKNDGVSSNDATGGDPDSGPNGMQNFPELLLAERDGSVISVTGELHSEANAAYRITLCGIAASHASNHGGCDEVLDDQLVVDTDATGDVEFTVTVPDDPAYRFLTATAARILGAQQELVSEFSLNLPIATASTELFTNSFED